MRLACETADEETVSRIVSTLTAWCADSGGDEAVVKGSNITTLIFVAITERLGHLERATTNQEPIQELLTLIGSGKCAPRLTMRAWTALAESSAPLALRQASALEMIEGNHRYPICPKSLRSLMGPEMFPALREIVRRPVDAEQFNLCAASALAHYGDQEILPDLEAWVPKLAAVGHHVAGFPPGYIRKINAQNPPSRILEHIAPQSGLWAMERALELGLSKSEVRDALLKHVAKLKSAGTKDTGSRMIMAKHHGFELGVLQPGDLPNIKVPKLDVME